MWILLLIGALLLLYVYLTWNNDYWLKRNVAFAKPSLFFGNFKASFLQKKHNVYEIAEIYNDFVGKTPYAGMFQTITPQLLLIDPAMVKNVLISNFKNFSENEFSAFIDKENDPIMSRNPFVLNGEEWKEKRAEITPAFTNAKIRAMYPIIDDVCKKLQKHINIQVEKGVPEGIEAKELCSKFTVDVVSSAIYGVDSQAFTNEKSEIREVGSQLFSQTASVIIYFLLIAVFPFIKIFYKKSLIAKKVESFFTKLMDDAVKLRRESNIQRDDYLNFLLELQKKKNLSNLDIAAHTITFFLDGFETSSGVAALLLFQLAKHPEIQTKLRNEINQFIKENGKIGADNINDIEYLDQVFNESQRINPIVATIGKRCTVDTEFTDNKDKSFTLKKGTVAVVPIYSIHNDPQHYPNPHVFDPDRFSNENGGLKQYKDKCVYLAFGDGPRICLGMRFATIQLKAAIIEIIRNFEISVNSKTEQPTVFDPKYFLLLPKGGIWLDYKPLYR